MRTSTDGIVEATREKDSACPALRTCFHADGLTLHRQGFRAFQRHSSSVEGIPAGREA